MLKTPRIALIGNGWWGKNIGRNLHELGVLAVVADSDAERLSFAEEKFPGVGLHRDAQEVLDRTDIDAVCIAAPAAAHAAIGTAALRAGKDVFVEKPLALQVEEGRALVEEAEKRGRILMVGHLLQYHPAVLKLKEIVAGGRLGALRYIYSNRLNLGKVRREENILWSFAPHDIDIIMLLAGSMPGKVLAVGASYLQPRIADTTVTHLFFEGSLQAHIYVSWLHPFKDQRLVVVGSDAMAVFDDVKPGDKLVIHRGKVDVEEGKPIVVTQSPAVPVDCGSGEPLRAEMEHFIACVGERKRPRTDGAVGLRVLAVLQACQRSMGRGGTIEAVEAV
jgi:UDP-2-acetamido-3-amino-2,3-dideoxy-glucuronate N-acetyltransferase